MRLCHGAKHPDFFPHVEHVPVPPAVEHFILEAAPTLSLASHESKAHATIKSAIRHTLIVWHFWGACSVNGRNARTSANFGSLPPASRSSTFQSLTSDSPQREIKDE